MSDVSRRVLFIVLVVGAVLGIGIADRLLARPEAPAVPSLPASAVLAPADASSSAWYCAGPAAAPAGTGITVVVTNPSSTPLAGSLAAIEPGQSAAGQTTAFQVAPAGQLAVPLAAPSAAEVLLRGGGAGVLEEIQGANGWSTAPCSSATSTTWYFAHGSTASGRSLGLALYNPTPTDAVVNVSFVSASAGLVAPPAYQGLPVSAGTVVVESVADHVPNDPSLATIVTVLSGRVAADEVSGSSISGAGELAVVSGVSAPTTVWAFAQNMNLQGGGNGFNLFNPNPRPAHVTISLALTQGQAAPLTLTVPPVSVASIGAQGQTRIPPNAVFGVTLESDVGIVAAREVVAPAGSPGPAIGLSGAAPGGVWRWLVPPLPAPATAPWALAVVNLASRPVHVTVAARDAAGHDVGTGVTPRTALSGGGVLYLGPGPAYPVGRLPLVVSADGPVAVELDPEPVGAPGTVVVPAWPLP